MKIAWICPKPGAPSGGVWFIHRLAGLAADLGHDSWVAQTEPFDVWWDSNPNKQGGTHLLSDGIPDDSTVIVPEGLWDSPIPNRANAICFMQNYIWLNKEHFLFDPGPMITCSRFQTNYAKDKLATVPLGQLTPFLDDDVWTPGTPSKNRVLIMARRSEIALRLRNILEADGYPVSYVDYPISQRDLSKTLTSGQFYLHLPSPEGFPMAALEAMRSGVAVIGTTGGGGNEFMFHKRTAYIVQDPELGLYENDEEYIRRLKSGLDWMRDNPIECSQIVDRAKSWSKRYAAHSTKLELVNILEKLNA